MTIRTCFLIFIIITSITQINAQTSVADGNWSDGTTWGGISPGYTGLTNPVIDSYVIAYSSLTFSNSNGNTLTVRDTLIVYGDVTFPIDKNNAAVTIGENNVLIIFGNLEMGKNNAGVSIASGGVLVVKGNITASGNNGQITGEGSYYTDGSTSGMQNNSSNPEGTIDDLSDDNGDNAGDYDSIEEFIRGGGDTPLPVILKYFHVEKDEDIKLTWATATEINNDYFSIERSEDGKSFYKIGQVDGNGNSKKEIEYAYVDKTSLSGMVYYRLKQVDFDGNYEYSPVRRIEVTLNALKQTINIHPTRVNVGQQLFIALAQPEEDIESAVYSLSGAAFSHLVDVSSRGSDREFVLNVSRLPKGIYLVRIQAGKAAITRRFTVTSY